MDGRKGPLLVLEYPGGKGGGMNMKLEQYCEQVLNGVLKEFYVEMEKKCGQVYFQQDNASCHVSKRVKKWFDDHNIPLLFHPPNSPNLSPVERVWHELKSIIRSFTPQPTTIDELKATVNTAWEQLDIDDVNKHVSSMPDRVATLLKARALGVDILDINFVLNLI